VPSCRIPFNRPTVAGNELQYIARAIESGHTAACGPFTEACTRSLENLIGAPRVLLTTSCTHALEMCAFLLDLQPGDEVIVPSFAFVSTAAAFASRGATLVFVDVRPDTLNLDEQQVERRITPRTRAILALHYAGVACEMHELLRLGEKYGIAVVEDAAHGPFGSYRGRQLGTFGVLATLSFHETKNLTSGEGGALIINDLRLEDRARIIHRMGTDRHRFNLGMVDRYTWVDHGSSYAPADLVAAYLLAQLESRESIQQRRRRIWERYHRELADWAAAMNVRVPCVPAHCEQSFHMYYLVLPAAGVRRRFIGFLASRGIMAAFHYQPLHASRMGRLHGRVPNDCPVAGQLGSCAVLL